MEELDKWTKILTMAIVGVWTRYTFIPRNAVNPKVVKAGIFDKRLGDNGRPIIRFCYPSVGEYSQSRYSRLVIDPTGYPNPNNLHVPLPKFVVTLVGLLQSACQFLIKCIFLISIFVIFLRCSNKTEEESTKETNLIIVEYCFGLFGGLVAGTVGGVIGSFDGPVFSICGQLLGSMIGAYYGLMV